MNSQSELWDVGDLACGDLLLQLRQKLRSLPPSSRLQLIVRDPGAREDLPAWCRLTGHHLVHQDHPHYLLESKAAASPARIIPAATLDGGDLDCGSGLLLLIRRHIDPLDPGSILELHSTESTVESDLPAWCRLTDNHLVATQQDPGTRRRTYWIRKKMVAVPGSTSTPLADRTAENFQNDSRLATPLQAQPAGRPAIPAIAPPPPLAVMGIGSWPRPPQLVAALHERLSGRLESESFHQLADAAVRACVSAQQRAGVTVVTDGEQRRDSYASFVGALLDNCQLVPLTDLLPYVDDPEEFARELQALDVPADSVRHPAVLGRLRRSTPWTVREAQFLRQITDQPIKIALPGPYLLTRTMWLECVAERVYATRDELAADLVTALRAEVCELLEAGVNLVQLDEPVLSEVVFGAAVKQRSFMCGALSGKGSIADELAFAAHLLQQVIADLPRERVALHVCRGNWSRDERLALRGGYEPLVEMLASVPVGCYFLELCTPRAGEWEVLRQLPPEARIGVGMLNPKTEQVESVAELKAAIRRACNLFGRDRVLLNPDCGFATFADNPVSSVEIAEAKLRALVTAAQDFQQA